MKHADFVILCQGALASGEPYWAYVNVSAIRVKAFKKAQSKGAFNLEEYGTIVTWGQGACVPDDVKAQMEQDHGMNHAFEGEIKKKMR